MSGSFAYGCTILLYLLDHNTDLLKGIRMLRTRPEKFKTGITLLVIMALLLVLGAGCAHKPEQEQTARQLADEGMAKFKKGHYKKAVEAFERLQDWYPFSKYATLADLKIADPYYEMKEYDSAVTAYEAFERLHPRNEALPSVIYRMGLCHFNRLDTIDRDQTPAKNAIEAFTRLRRQFPDSEYAAKAEAHIDRCRRSLAAHHLYVGKFYFKSNHFQAARERFRQVIDQYPDEGDVQTAEDYLRLCEEALADAEAEEKAAAEEKEENKEKSAPAVPEKNE